jgi:4-hydroxy-tetrahydrodipicolinate reductase
MKISLIGYGKTGRIVAERIGNDPQAQLGGIYDRSNPPSAGKLAGDGSDALVIFVPGTAVAPLIDPVIASGIPAVWGSTGAAWPADLQGRLVERGTPWVVSPNFSIGMAWIRHCLQWFSQGGSFPDPYRLAIHEVHHAAKMDRPSGTALDWKARITSDASSYDAASVDITSERSGDEPGLHVLSIDGPGESMSLIHQAKDRSVFADGAILSARWLADTCPAPGIHDFDEVIASGWSASTSDPYSTP